MRTRKILLTTRRDRVLAIVRDGVVVKTLDGASSDPKVLARGVREAADESGTLFLLTTETRMVKAKQLTHRWELVRREGGKWVSAEPVVKFRCAFCRGRGSTVISAATVPCRKCRGEGEIAKPPATYSTRAAACRVRDDNGIKCVVRKVRS